MIETYPSRVDFLIPGVQKGGTTALHAYLALHPQLVPPEGMKELQFFSGSDKNVDWYHRQFPQISYQEKLCYESTPDYICGYNFIADIAKYKARYSPKLKLILIFRAPEKRAYSQWNMTRHLIKELRDPNNKKGWTLKELNPYAYDLFSSMAALPSFERCFEIFLDSFEEITPVKDLRQLNEGGLINEIPGQFFVRGLYFFALKALFEFFHSEDLLILESTELENNTIETLDKVVRFLDISPYEWPEPEISVPRHVSIYEKSIDPNTENRIKSFYAPYNQAFFALAKKNYNWA
ncbi:MAG: sulfotransferase domain-containing protein [Deltaproteobacteria bacterium]|nr:sulfotransferase domain-containing protein [Deltaproteobacteria bacterium]